MHRMFPPAAWVIGIVLVDQLTKAWAGSVVVNKGEWWLTVIIVVCLWWVWKRGWYVILGGGIANLIDRLVWGGVRDFIYLPFMPVVNLADVAITIGAVWISLRYLRKPKIF